MVIIEVPFAADANAAYTCAAKRNGDNSPLFDEFSSTHTGVTGEADDNSLVFPVAHGLSPGDVVKVTSKASGGAGLSLNTNYAVLSIKSATEAIIDINFTTDIVGAVVTTPRSAVIQRAFAKLAAHIQGNLTAGPVMVTNPGSQAITRPI